MIKADASAALHLSPSASFPIACVGESRYQGELESICGGRTRDSVEQEVTAILILEDTNPYDSEAVRVEVDGIIVGYMTRPDAQVYRRLLTQRAPAVKATQCRAQIRGGWERGEDRGSYGIWLDLPIYSESVHDDTQHAPREIG